MRSKVLRTAAFLVAVYLALSLLVFPRMALSVPVHSVYATPASVGLDYEDVDLVSDGLRLAAWWIPADDESAVMIFAHGAGANRTSAFFESLDFYAAMNRLGISILTMDLRNHGDSERTDGRLGMGRTEWRDVAAARQWLDDRQLATNPVVIAGASMGGAVTMYAAANGVKADAWIMFDPALDNSDALARGGEITYGIPAVFFYPYAAAAVAFYGVAGDTENALAVGSAIDVPMLLIQDPQDPVTVAEHAQALATLNPLVRLAMAPPVTQGEACLEGKGRWAAHVAAFACHPDWTLARVAEYLAEMGVLNTAARPGHL